MQYTTVNKEEVGAAIYKQDAIEAARDEFAAKCEVERLKALLTLATSDEETEAIKVAIENAEKIVEKAKKRATRKARIFEVDQHDINHKIEEFLDSWIAQIEKEHAENSVRLEALETELDDEDDDFEEDEREFMELKVREHLAAIKVLESAWKIAAGHKEALNLHDEES